MSIIANDFKLASYLGVNVATKQMCVMINIYLDIHIK